MTDDNRISRRQSLKGLAITGSIVGAAGVGASSVSAGSSKLNQVYLDPYCYDPCEKEAEFRICNNVRKTMSFVYRVEETGEKGRVKVKSNGYTEYGYFRVKAPEGKVTVKLYYESKKKKDDDPLIATATADPDDHCNQGLSENDVTLEAVQPKFVKKGGKDGKDHDKRKSDKNSKEHEKRKSDKYDTKGSKDDKGKDGKKKKDHSKHHDGKRYAEFIARNHTDSKVCVTWKVDTDDNNDNNNNNDGYGGVLSIPADGSKRFKVKIPKNWPEDALVVTLNYDGHSTSADLYSVWNVSQKSGYASIQEAIDAADENDKIVVYGPRDYEENVHVTESVRLVGVCEPRVVSQSPPDFSPSEAAMLIDADDVSVKGIDLVEGISPGDNQDILEIADGVSGTVVKNLNVLSPDFTGAETGQGAIGVDGATGDLSIRNVHADRTIGLVTEDDNEYISIKNTSVVKSGDNAEALWITGPNFGDADTLDLELHNFEPMDNEEGTGGDTDVMIFGHPASVNGETGSPSEQADRIFADNPDVDIVEIDDETFER